MGLVRARRNRSVMRQVHLISFLNRLEFRHLVAVTPRAHLVHAKIWPLVNCPHREMNLKALNKTIPRTI